MIHPIHTKSVDLATFLMVQTFIINDPSVSACRSYEPGRPLSAVSAPDTDSAAEERQQHDNLSRLERTSTETEVTQDFG